MCLRIFVNIRTWKAKYYLGFESTIPYRFTYRCQWRDWLSRLSVMQQCFPDSDCSWLTDWLHVFAIKCLLCQMSPALAVLFPISLEAIYRSHRHSLSALVQPNIVVIIFCRCRLFIDYVTGLILYRYVMHHFTQHSVGYFDRVRSTKMSS